MIALIILGAFLMIEFFSMIRLNSAIVDFITALKAPGWLTLIMILLMYLVLGCFIDSMGMILLTVPAVFPVIQHLGYDPVWFGILLVIVVETGMITPPLGMNVFAIKAVARDIPIGEIFRGVVPFWFADIFRLLLLIIFPFLVFY